MKNNLLDFDLQLFAEEEVADAEVSEAVEPTEETAEPEGEETGEQTGDSEPAPQSDEENARYAAIRRRAEDEARKRYDAQVNQMNQQVVAMCQGITHPVTGKPITSAQEYFDALAIQQRQTQEQELQEKGIDPSMIDRMIATNPVVMQAQQVIERSKATEAEAQVQRDLEELSRIDPSIKTMSDLAALPNLTEMLDMVATKGVSIVEAYKMCNFDTFMQHTNEAARQQAINQMRGKSHLPSQGQNVATDDDDVDVPADIMARFKADGKTEKQIKELYKRVPH